MKQNDSTDINKLLEPQNFENLFNVELDESGSYYYNVLRTVKFPTDLDSDSYTEYTVVPGDTWPYIAWKHYENVKLWWVICAVNQIDNPVAQPEPGVILKILPPLIVSDILGVIRNQ